MKLDKHGRLANPRDKLEVTLQFTPELDKFVQEVKQQLILLEQREKQPSEAFNMLEFVLYKSSKLQQQIYKLLLNKPDGMTQKELAITLDKKYATIYYALKNKYLFCKDETSSLRRNGRNGRNGRKFFAVK